MFSRLAFRFKPRLAASALPLALPIHAPNRLTPLLQQQQRRTLFHLPPLLGGALLAPKLLALLALKKVVLVAVLRKYGVPATFAAMRQANEDVAAKLGNSAYPPSAKQAMAAGINTLEAMVRQLDSVADQAQAMEQWLKQLDPKLASEFASNFLRDVRAGVTGMNGEPKVTIKPHSQEEADEEANAMIQLIHKRVPEVKRKFVVVLIEKKD